MTNGRSFFVRFARCFDYEKQLNDLSFLGSFYLPTKIVLYHNQTHKPQNPTAPPPPHHGAGSFCKSLDLRRGYVSYECTDAYHTRWAMPPPLGLEEFRWGHEQLLHFQPSCKLRFFSMHGYHKFARPVVWLWPIWVHWRLRHTMESAEFAWFGRIPSGGRIVVTIPTKL